jgi:SAM-dependent methyltransferase
MLLKKEREFEPILTEHICEKGLQNHPLVTDIRTLALQGVPRVLNVLARIEPFLPCNWFECRALDLGCSTGAASIALARSNYAFITGVDISRFFFGLNLARKHSRVYGYTIPFVQANACTLPFVSRSFDLCFGAWLIEHTEYHMQLLKEAYRVLRPKGILYISTHNRFYPWEPHSRLWGASWLPHKLAAIYAQWRGRTLPEHPWDVHLLSSLKLKKLLRSSGFKIVFSWNNLPFLPACFGDLMSRNIYIVAQR